MKHLTLPGHLILLLLLVSGCENYFGDQTAIPTDRLPASNQLVIGAAFTTLDSVLYLRTDRAQDLLSGFFPPGGASFVGPVTDEEDLEITLLQSGNPVTTFSHIAVEDRYDPLNPDQSILYSVSNNYDATAPVAGLEPGLEYMLEIVHPRLGTFEIAQTMPASVSAENPVVAETLTIDFSGNIAQTISISIHDAANQPNYYLVQAFSRIPGEDLLRSSTLYDQDPRTEEGRLGESYLVFNDVGNDGQTINLTFTSALTFADLRERVAAVDITAISPEWYQFVTSYNRYRTLLPDLNDGFVEPFQVYSNVPNGFGYFLLGNTTRYHIE